MFITKGTTEVTNTKYYMDKHTGELVSLFDIIEQFMRNYELTDMETENPEYKAGFNSNNPYPVSLELIRNQIPGITGKITLEF